VDDAVVLAAVNNVRKALIDALESATELQPNDREMTSLEKEAWEAYKSIAGSPKGLMFEGLSMGEIVDKAVDVLQKELKERSISCGTIEGL